MAKSSRATSRKKNNAALRAKVFGPVYDARTERLSAKLQEVAAKPRVDNSKKMEVDTQPESKDEEQPQSTSTGGEAMEIDTHALQNKSQSEKYIGRKRTSRVEKKVAKRKPRNQIRFPSLIARQKRQTAAKNK